MEYEDVIAEEGQLNKDISQKEAVKKGIVFDGSQVLYGKLRPYLHNWLNPDFSGVAVGDWWVLKPIETDKTFLYRLIQTQQFDDIANQSAGSKMPRADWTLVSNSEFAVPVSKYEQAKIGEYFSSLDSLITLHRCKPIMIDFVCVFAWEQRKLGEIAPLRGGFAFKSTEYKSDGVPIIRISNILSDGSIGDEFSYYNEIDDDDNFTLRNGAVLLAMSGATTGKVSILECGNTDKYYQNQRVGYFARTQGADYRFVSTLVRSDLFKSQLSSVLVTGAQPNVSSKEIDSFEFMIPHSVEEQTKIGQYFSNLDHLITLHQRKQKCVKNTLKYIQIQKIITRRCYDARIRSYD